MTRHIPDDRRYMTHEVRAIDDARYRGEIKRDTAAAETCYCGKTVVRTHGVPVRLDGEPVECPRACKPPVPNPEKVRRDSIKALRTAWPHRHTLRGRIVVKANVAMLRRLR